MIACSLGMIAQVEGQHRCFLVCKGQGVRMILEPDAPLALLTTHHGYGIDIEIECVAELEDGRHGGGDSVTQRRCKLRTRICTVGSPTLRYASTSGWSVL